MSAAGNHQCGASARNGNGEAVILWVPLLREPRDPTKAKQVTRGLTGLALCWDFSSFRKRCDTLDCRSPQLSFVRRVAHDHTVSDPSGMPRS